jgi:hypothetical protein
VAYRRPVPRADRRRWIGWVAATAAVLASPVCTPPAYAAEPVPGVVAIGDSVMQGARSILRKQGIRVDAKVSRQATSAPALIRRLGDRLPATVIVHLGTNGTFPASTCRDIVKAAGPSRRIYLMTIKVPRRWQRSNNSVIRSCARRYPKQVTVIDWNWAASRHRGWLYADGYHLRPAGARGYVSVIKAALQGSATG